MNTVECLCSSSTEVVSILQQSPIPDLRHIRVEENDSEVILTGHVSSYYIKQLAQETIRTAIAKRRLRNRVLVAQK